MCHLRSETLRVSPILSHPPDPDTRSLQLFHHFPPRFSSAATPITCARRRRRTSGEWGGNTDSYSQDFIQGKRNASSVGMRLSTPSIDPNLSQRGNLTSSRLDPTEQRSFTETTGSLL